MGILASLNSGLGFLGATIGASLVIIGAGLAIGKAAVAALEGTARQPDAGADLRTTMIIPAALIEGIALFALVICLLAANNAVTGHALELKTASQHAAAVTDTGTHDVAAP